MRKLFLVLRPLETPFVRCPDLGVLVKGTEVRLRENERFENCLIFHLFFCSHEVGKGSALFFVRALNVRVVLDA